MKILKKVFGSKIGKIGLAISSSLISVCSFAAAGSDTVAGIRAHFVSTSNNAMSGIMLVAAIVGVAYIGFGLFSLKAGSDSAGQANQNVQKGIVKLILGGCLVSIPFLMHVSQSVLQSGSSLNSGMSIPNATETKSETDMTAS